jgi:hypothetical protein
VWRSPGEGGLPGDEQLPLQPRVLGLAAQGLRLGPGWLDPEATWEVYDLLAVFDEVVRRLLPADDPRRLEREPAERPGLHPGRTAVLHLDGREVGVVGQLHPNEAEARDLPESVVVGELVVEGLLAEVPDAGRAPVPAWPLVRHPAMGVDVALVADEEVAYTVLEDAVRRGAGELLDALWWFDEYRGEQVGEGAAASRSACACRRRPAADRRGRRAGDRAGRPGGRGGRRHPAPLSGGGGASMPARHPERDRVSDVRLRGGVVIPESELEFRAARSGGPGGQSVNTTSSKIELRWSVRRLGGAVGAAARAAAAAAVVPADRRRRADPAGLGAQVAAPQPRGGAGPVPRVVGEALTPPRPRKRTRPSRGAKERRLREKKHRGEKKRLRKPPEP